MKNLRLLMPSLCLMFLGSAGLSHAAGEVKLPPLSLKGKMGVEQAIAARKSVRDFKAAPLSLAEMSQMLWAAGGNLRPDAVTGATRKVYPSAGGLYPLEVFVAVGNGTVENLPAGVYRYDPEGNSLRTLAEGDKRPLIANAALGQAFLARAPALIVIGGVFGRTTAKYGNRGVNYVFMEAGNANQNLCLQAEALGVRSGTVGAFNDAQVAAAMQLPADTAPLLIVGVGK
jgi:SagB-type dehydrogenase family enzyme